MKRRPLLLAALAALTVIAAVPAEAQRRGTPARAAPARVDWVRAAVRTPEGGVRIGNPAAPVKLIEFGSITCPHCAEFARTGTQPLYAYVRSGRVSWEYRPYMIFPTDPGIFALLGCQAPGAFFGTVEQLYATQPSWALLVQTYIEGNQAQLETMAVTARAAALVRAGRVDRLFAARGMTAGQINACLASQANLMRVAETTRRAVDSYDIPGTPTFYINGVQAQNVGVWTDLEPLLIRAGARGR
jgi:protein-disulfide isomerase